MNDNNYYENPFFRNGSTFYSMGNGYNRVEDTVSGYNEKYSPIRPFNLNVNEYSVVGMDVTKVQAAIDAIDTYIKKLNDKAMELNESANVGVMIKSETIQDNVRFYIESVERCCAGLCSSLEMFKEKLLGAQEAWEEYEQARGIK